MAHYGVGPILFDGAGVSHVTATNSVELGTRLEYDGNLYVYIHNAGGTQVSIGEGVTVSAAGGYSCTVSSVTMVDAFVGVCHHSTIAAGSYGWVVARGVSKLKAMANSIMTAGDVMCAGGDGRWTQNSVVTNAVSPWVHAKVLTATASGGLGTGYVQCLYA